MNWHKGNIEEAVEESKTKSAIFIVYIKGQDEMTAKLDRFLNDIRVSSKLQASDFVGVKIEGDSSACAQFISLYKVVPVPSIFFIGKTGMPLEIATGVVGSVEELVAKIDKVLMLAGKQMRSETLASGSAANELNTDAATSRSIGGVETGKSNEETALSTKLEEKVVAAEQVIPVSAEAVIEPAVDLDPEPATPEPIAIVTAADPVLVAKLEPVAAPELVDTPEADGVLESDATRKPVEQEPVPAPEQKVAALSAAVAAEKRAAAASAAQATEATTSSMLPNSINTLNPMVVTLIPSNATSTQSSPRSPAEEAELRMQDIQNLVEERRKQREEQQKRRNKESSLRRRREVREAQAKKVISREQELKNLQERIRRDRQQEQETRERILSQIAADRAEHANRMATSAATQSISTAPTSTTVSTPENPISSVIETRLQIRLPGGITRTKAFPVEEPLATVRGYVIEELLADNNTHDFTLAASYPRREFKTEDEIKTLNELSLVPNAVLLVLKSEPTNRVVRSGNNVMNIVTSMIWAILTPAAVAFDYINKMGFQRLKLRFIQFVSSVGWGRGPEDVNRGNASPPRNMDVLMLGSAEGLGMQRGPTPHNTVGSGPNQAKPELLSNDGADGAQQDQDVKPQRSGGFKPVRYGETNIRRFADTMKDDDEDKATYNGNSTQQQ